jgi:hypothetical protein
MRTHNLLGRRFGFEFRKTFGSYRHRRRDFGYFADLRNFCTYEEYEECQKRIFKNLGGFRGVETVKKAYCSFVPEDSLPSRSTLKTLLAITQLPKNSLKKLNKPQCLAEVP